MRFSPCIPLLLLALVSCRKKDYDDVKIIGHAGSGLAVTNTPYHDNSLESIEYALEMEGIDGVEVDVQCSANGSAWMFHDLFIDGATNGSGCVPSRTDDYLETLHYSTAEKESLARLDELDFPPDNKELFLDIRSSNACTDMLIDVQIIVQAVQSALPGVPPGNIIVVTNKAQWIGTFYQLGWKVFYETGAVNAYLSSTHLPETTGLCIRNAHISKDEVATIQKAGKQVVIFEVRSPRGIRLALKKRPEYLMTDDLKATLIEKY